MTVIHHTAICVRDVDASLRFWHDGLGFEVLMDGTFEGDWPTLLRAPSPSLRSVFLGDPANADAGVVELVDLGPVDDGGGETGPQATTGVLVLSVMTDVQAALDRLAGLGAGGEPRRVVVEGVAIAVVHDPDGVAVELIDIGAAANLERMTGAGSAAGDSGVTEPIAVAVLGAGFGGLALADRLAQDGIDDVVLFEREDGVGGTWRVNSYPGAACDVPSHLYSLSFGLNPEWSRAYAAQPEILRYVEDCYDRFDVRRKVHSNTEIVSATWDERATCWRLVDRAGGTYAASVLVSAVGLFNTPSIPPIPGLDEFAGTMFHSARWCHDHDLTGRRVAVIGTGASAIQVVPAIVDRVEHLDLYQRSAPWVMPRRDPPYTPEQRQAFVADPAAARQHRQELHDAFEKTTIFMAGDSVAEAVAVMALDHVATAVTDPVLRDRLTPTEPFGCKRTLVSSDYYPAVQRDHVDLVADPIERVTPTGIRTVDGLDRPADTLVLCTGFRASEYLRGVAVVGRNGADLHARWGAVPRAYHGIAVPGFPNLFVMYGPNTNQGGNSILLILEAQAQFVASALGAMRDAGASSMDVTEEAMARYEADLEHDLGATVWSDCNSYFRSATGDVVTQLPHTSGWYRAATESIERQDFTFGGVTRTTR